MAITHKFVSAKPASADPTQVGSAEWNDDHTVTFGTGAGDIAEGNHLHAGVYLPVGTTDFVSSTDANWIDLTDGGTTTLHSHAGGSGDISGTGVVGQVAEFVTNTKTLQAAKIIGPAVNILTLTNAAASTLALNITAAKTLTLTAADNYTLTIPATGTAALLATANVFTQSNTIPQIEIASNTGFVSGGNAKIYRHSTYGLSLQGWAGTTNNFSVFTPTGSVVLSNPIGTNNLVMSQTGRLLIGTSTSTTAIVDINNGSVGGSYVCLRINTHASQTVPVAHFESRSTTTNAVREVQRLETTVSSASTGGAAGLGPALDLYAETATDGTNQQQARVAASWVDATNATRKAKMSLSAYDTAARLGIEIEASGSAAKLGFYGVTTIVRPTTAVAEAAFTENAGGTAVNVDSTFGGYTLQQIAQALQNLGLLT